MVQGSPWKSQTTKETVVHFCLVVHDETQHPELRNSLCPSDNCVGVFFVAATLFPATMKQKLQDHLWAGRSKR